MSEFDEEVDSESVVDQIHAELVAKEKEALEVIKEDICKWLSKIIVELKDISPNTFLDALETGVPLCKLVSLIQKSAAAAIDSEKKLKFTVPMAALSCTLKAESGSFFARDNTANFISWCRELGVDEAVIFESEGLVLHKDEKRVILCLLDVARYAERMGIPPPELVRMEREIELLEASGKESSPVSWEEGEEGREEQKIEGIKEIIVDASAAPPTTQLDERVTPTRSITSKEASLSDKDMESSDTIITATSDIKSKESAPPDKNKDSNATIITPEQKLAPSSQRTNLPASSRKLLFTPSRIPVPVSGTTRTHHQSQNVQSASRQLRKRRRDEQEMGEGGHRESHKAKKLKISPTASTVTLIKEDSSPLQEKKVRKEERAVVQEVAMERRHESVDEKVMRRMGECTCSNKIKVKNCGQGKFIVRGASGKNITIYARMLSDRVMVRVGGGWDTLDHFLLKHDPFASSAKLKAVQKSLLW